MYYIYDANNELFGNPSGYKTRADAQRIATRYRHKLWCIYIGTPEVRFSSSIPIYEIDYIAPHAFS